MVSLDFWHDKSQRSETQAQSDPTNGTHQSDHRLLSGIGRTMGGPGALATPAGKYPSPGRRSAPGPQPDLRQRHLLRAAYPPEADQWKALDHTTICSGSTAHLRFQEWVRAGVFLKLWEVGLERYDELKGLDWSWLSMDGAMTKAPLGGEKNRAQPDRPG